MLFLDRTQVKYCKLQEKNQEIPGIIYNGSVFIRAKSFPKEELETAIKECREEYLDHEERSQIPTLLVKGKDSVDIWMKSERHQAANATPTSESQSAAKASEASASLGRISIRQLASEMRSPTGVEIKTRRHKIKLYQHCFVGREAVDWIAKRAKISRADAVKLGQKMLDKGIFSHVLEAHSFKDDHLFYRFSEDRGKSIWNSNI